MNRYQRGGESISHDDQIRAHMQPPLMRPQVINTSGYIISVDNSNNKKDHKMSRPTGCILVRTGTV